MQQLHIYPHLYFGFFSLASAISLTARKNHQNHARNHEWPGFLTLSIGPEPCLPRAVRGLSPKNGLRSLNAGESNSLGPLSFWCGHLLLGDRDDQTRLGFQQLASAVLETHHTASASSVYQTTAPIVDTPHSRRPHKRPPQF